jgi:ABC-type polar amino acid transport system ATPase subunit
MDQGAIVEDDGKEAFCQSAYPRAQQFLAKILHH